MKRATITTTVSMVALITGVATSHADVPPGCGPSRSGTFFADVTGDGKADAIMVNHDQLTGAGNIYVRRSIRLSTGDTFGVWELWSSVPFHGSIGTYFADVDGDRKADAIAVNYDKVLVRRSDGGAFLTEKA